MQVKIFNSKVGAKQVLKPKFANEIRLYVCGMTVYGSCHIGHARVMIVFDVIVKILKHFGYQLTYVRNVTDIDDKIIAKGIKEGLAWQSVAKKYLHEMHLDEDSLGISRPDYEPKATAYIKQMISMITKLLENKSAYIAADKDVYFSVKSFEKYGAVSGQDLASLTHGVRKALSKSKLNKLDFVLWKAAKDGEPSWDSPWGKGRPGWHIECSAMATEILGDHIDLHGGGVDLKFPHHENETAQAEAAGGSCFVNTWLHVGHVRVDKEKMSKSLGNFVTIKEVVKKFHPEVVRYFLLSSHYRSPLSYAVTAMQQAKASLLRLYAALDKFDLAGFDQDKVSLEFANILADDFNFPQALAFCFDLVGQINLHYHTDLPMAKQLAQELKNNLSLMGLGLATLDEVGHYQINISLSEADIEQFILQRQQAKQAKDWDLADKIRNDLLVLGVVLEDFDGQTKWRIKTN